MSKFYFYTNYRAYGFHNLILFRYYIFGAQMKAQEFLITLIQAQTATKI